MQDFEIRGYGIQFDRHCGSNTTVDKIRAMLELAPELEENVNEWLAECDVPLPEATVDDYAEFDQDNCDGIPALIAKAITEIEGINMETASDEDGVVYLFMSACMPWEFNDKERAMTADDYIAMLSKYWHMLYEGESDIDRVSIHQFG